MDDGVRFVPSADEQAWLLEQLRALVEAQGYEHLILAPLIRPEPTFFVDPWDATPAAFRRMLRRLLIYADIEAQVKLKVFDDVEAGTLTPAGPGAGAWLVRKQGETLHFATRISTLRDHRLAMAAAARAVAEAWRAHHGLGRGQPIDEQRLVDVTAVFLGFGVVTLDARVRHGTGSHKSVLGVLPAQAIAFALAVQLCARGLESRAIRRLARGLQANPRGFVHAAHQALPEATDVRASLAVPDPQTWANPPSLPDLVAPLDDDLDAEPEQPDEPEAAKVEDRGVLGTNEGKPVFRVERNKAFRLARMLGLPVVLLAMLAGRMQLPFEVPMGPVALVAAGLALAGLAVGRFLPDVRCSEPKCQTPLRPDMSVCPRCGGTIVGTIAHPRERLAAEEAWNALAQKD